MVNRRRAVFNADPSHLEEVERLVRSGRYRNLSEFVRQAMEEALRRERAGRVAEQLAAYVEAGHAEEDVDLVATQAWPATARRGGRQTRRAPK